MSDIGLSLPHVEEISLKPLGTHRSNSYYMGYINPACNWEICWAFRQCKDSFKSVCTHINSNLPTTHKVDTVSLLQMRTVRLRKVAHLDKTLGPDPECWTENKVSQTRGKQLIREGGNNLLSSPCPLIREPQLFLGDSEEVRERKPKREEAVFQSQERPVCQFS